MNSVRDALNVTRKALEDAGFCDCSFQASELVRAAFFEPEDRRSCNLLTAVIRPNKAQQGRLLEMTSKRIGGYPLQYIVGEWDFYALPFYVGEGVLIPRADTETLVETCIEFLQSKKINRPLRVLDLCSGSGCIAIALKKTMPSLDVYAVEKSEIALEFLRRNAQRNQANITVINGDALVCDKGIAGVNDGVNGKFDLIVSNPPYLDKAQMEPLQEEVTHEPSMALYGEEDGLFFYKTIAAQWKRCIFQGGMLAFEVGFTGAQAVCDILHSNGYKNICQKRDLCGIIRCVYSYLV